MTRTPCDPSVLAPVGSSWLFFLLAGVFAGLDWIALVRGWRRTDYIAKPTVILALIAGIGCPSSIAITDRLLIWVVIALTLSLVGDILLMLPRERFLGGLVAFLLAYLAYAVAFTPTWPPITISSLLLGLMCFLALAILYRSILKGLNASGRIGYKIPALLFGISLTLMTYTALLTSARLSWPQPSANLIGIGALLLFTSDSLLAWNRFIREVSNARVKIRIAYHLGQIAVVIGVSLAL